MFMVGGLGLLYGALFLSTPSATSYVSWDFYLIMTSGAVELVLVVILYRRRSRFLRLRRGAQLAFGVACWAANVGIVTVGTWDLW
jgi:hypothetical protein